LETVIKRTYEGLFLVDSARAAADWNRVTGTIEKILSRSEAEIVSLRKWDERKLAYEINKKSRGTYILVYFNCDPARIGSIERDVQLSESVIRVLILRADRMPAEMMEKPTPAMIESAAAEAEAAKEAAGAEVAEEAAQAAEETAPPEEAGPAAPQDLSQETSADEKPGDSESAGSTTAEPSDTAEEPGQAD